jgi:Fe-S-cluster-containing hydrogenase component 2
MIVADRKPLSEVWAMVSGFQRVLVLGCAGCAAACRVGGAGQVTDLSRELRRRAESCGRTIEFAEKTVRRQCETRYLEPVQQQLQQADAVLSMACGVGVNTLAENYPDLPAFPAVDTTFMGREEQAGVWAERCAGCGRCILHLTGGICPIARCAKNIMNGPCGGNEAGMCELSSPEAPLPCVWMRIIDRCRALGTLERLSRIAPPKDWEPSRHGGPRQRVCGEADAQEGGHEG